MRPGPATVRADEPLAPLLEREDLERAVVRTERRPMELGQRVQEPAVPRRKGRQSW